MRLLVDELAEVRKRLKDLTDSMGVKELTKAQMLLAMAFCYAFFAAVAAYSALMYWRDGDGLAGVLYLGAAGFCLGSAWQAVRRWRRHRALDRQRAAIDIVAAELAKGGRDLTK